MRHKPAQKPHEIVCGFCDYTSISNVKMIRHMKASHTQTNLMGITPRILSEDLSVLSDEDNKTDETEKLLSETERCEELHSVVVNGDDTEKPQPSETLDEISQNPVPTVKPLPLYKCNECSFTTITTEELQEHKIMIIREKRLLMQK